MTSVEYRAFPPRVSDADREHALEVLRLGAEQGRLSHDTFVRRMDMVFRARRYEELDAVLQDLGARRPGPRWLLRTVRALSVLPVRARQAWQTERLPELLLPPGPHALTIGRAPGSMLRLNDFTVSRAHARLRCTGDSWTLRDLGSSNGTWVNGRRVSGKAQVRPGDAVMFGSVGFRLTAP